MNSLSLAHDAGVQMIDTSVVRVHQHGASITSKKGRLGQYSTEMQSQRAHLLQPVPLPRAQLGRTVLQ